MEKANLTSQIYFLGWRFLPMIWLRRCVAFALGALTAVIFPPFDLAWLAWLAYALLPACQPRELKYGAFRLGFFFGFGHFLFSLMWLRHVMWVIPPILATICAIFWGLWLWSYVRLRSSDKPIRSAVAGASLWVLFDALRSVLFTGFPWNFPVISQWQFSTILSPIPWFGLSFVSFFIILFNLLIYEWWPWRFQQQRTCDSGDMSKKGLKSAQITSFFRKFLVTIASYVLLFYSFAGLSSQFIWTDGDGTEVKTLRILAIQGNMPQCRNFTQEELKQAISLYTGLTRAAMAAGETFDVVVWPETAVPAALRYNRLYTQELSQLSQEVDAPMIVGTVDLVYHENGQDYDTYNSVFLINNGQIEARYDKTHPVPFGEFVPFGDQFPQLNRWLGMGRNLTAGERFHVFELPQGARLGINICFEDVFTDISKKFVLNEANILMTVTNDAWYNESSGSKQHFINSLFRALESGRPFVRSGNRSYTCWVSPDGRINDLLHGEDESPFLGAYNLLEVPFVERAPLSPYHRFGYWFLFFPGLLVFSLILQRVVKAYQRNRSPAADGLDS